MEVKRWLRTTWLFHAQAYDRVALQVVSRKGWCFQAHKCSGVCFLPTRKGMGLEWFVTFGRFLSRWYVGCSPTRYIGIRYKKYNDPGGDRYLEYPKYWSFEIFQIKILPLQGALVQTNSSPAGWVAMKFRRLNLYSDARLIWHQRIAMHPKVKMKAKASNGSMVRWNQLVSWNQAEFPMVCKAHRNGDGNISEL